MTHGEESQSKAETAVSVSDPAPAHRRGAPITVPQLIGELDLRGIRAERKSVYDDLEALRLFGLDVQSRKGRSPGWFVGRREFELPELKLLVDVVQSSRFITRKKSDALIRKLEGLASSHQARQLQRQVYVSGRVKAMNESIYYNVDKLHTALSARKSITFRYFDYDMHRNKVFRREGRRYAVSPYGLIWNSENYYLVAYDISNQEMRHYRVDKMAEIVVTGLPREGEDRYPDFDVAAYGQKHFGMYSGEEASVTLRCRSHMAGGGVGPVRPGRDPGAGGRGPLHRHAASGAQPAVFRLAVRAGGQCGTDRAPKSGGGIPPEAEGRAGAVRLNPAGGGAGDNKTRRRSPDETDLSRRRGYGCARPDRKTCPDGGL